MAQIAEITIDKLENGLRLAAEFYTAKSLIGSEYYFGKDIIDFVQYGTSEELNENQSGTPTLRLNEFDSIFLGEPSKYCDTLSEKTTKGLLVKKGDVLVCRTNGNPKLVGKAAIAQNNFDFVFASYLFRIRPKLGLLNPETLVVFLNSNIGRSEIEKNLMVSNQSNFSPAKFREIKIPIYDKSVQDKIKNMGFSASAKHSQSKSLYAQAEQLLVQELGLENFVSEWTAGYATDFNSILGSFRMDAEYFQPKYKIVEDKIRKYKNGWKYLPGLLKISKQKTEIDEEKTYQYIELADINASLGIVNNTNKIIGADLPSRAKMSLQKGDVVVSSVEGSIAKVALIDQDIENLIGSTGFFVLRTKEFSPEVNLILCKSQIMQLLLAREAQGTILTAIPNKSLERVVVPFFTKEIQTKLTSLVQESHKVLYESRQLLEQAKREVEEMIEAKAN